MPNHKLGVSKKHAILAIVAKRKRGGPKFTGLTVLSAPQL
jgi:hypothetical protein